MHVRKPQTVIAAHWGIPPLALAALARSHGRILDRRPGLRLDDGAPKPPVDPEPADDDDDDDDGDGHCAPPKRVDPPTEPDAASAR